jgi:hypothetical protein
MTPDLDTLQTEILEYLEQGGFVVFHGAARVDEPGRATYWDQARFPDFRLFVETAKRAGVTLIVLHHAEFTGEDISEALEQLEECDLAIEERRALEHRLHELRVYESFTCTLELSFDHEGRTYIFELRAEWYEDFLDAIDEIESSIPDEGESDEPMGGYYSRN